MSDDIDDLMRNPAVVFWTDVAAQVIAEIIDRTDAKIARLEARIKALETMLLGKAAGDDAYLTQAEALLRRDGYVDGPRCGRRWKIMTLFERRREVPKVTDDEVRAEIDQLRAELDEVKRQLENRLGLLQARLDAYERQDAGIDEEALRRAIDALYVGMLRCGCSSAESEHLCRATLQRLAVVREVAATVH